LDRADSHQAGSFAPMQEIAPQKRQENDGGHGESKKCQYDRIDRAKADADQAE